METRGETTGKRIKELRKMQGMTQKELAEQLGVSISSVAMLETGKRTANDSVKRKLAKILGKSVDELFYW